MMFDYGKIVFFMAYLGFCKPGIGSECCNADLWPFGSLGSS